MDDDDYAELCDQIFMPINAVVRIFSFVNREDLENCKLVCRTWKSVIDAEDRQKSSQFQKRQIDALVISSNLEYSTTFYYGHSIRCYVYKKYFTDWDIVEVEVVKNQKGVGSFDEHVFRFPCGSRYPFRVAKQMAFPPANPFHHQTCKRVQQPHIYKYEQHYVRKLFTPPLGFYERLERMLHKCQIKRLIFHGFTFTDLFVEKLFEYARMPFSNVHTLILHCCNLRCISPKMFRTLLGGINARHYFMEHLRNCVREHINPTLLEQQSVKSAKIFYVGSCLERRIFMPVTFPIGDDAFLHFINSLVPPSTADAAANKANKAAARRKFFGIAQCHVTPKYKVQYEKVINNSGICLYEHVLFGDIRFLIGEMNSSN